LKDTEVEPVRLARYYFYMVAEMSGYKNPPVFSKEKPYDKYVEEICS